MKVLSSEKILYVVYSGVIISTEFTLADTVFAVFIMEETLSCLELLMEETLFVLLSLRWDNHFGRVCNI